MQTSISVTHGSSQHLSLHLSHRLCSPHEGDTAASTRKICGATHPSIICKTGYFYCKMLVMCGHRVIAIISGNQGEVRATSRFAGENFSKRSYKRDRTGRREPVKPLCGSGSRSQDVSHYGDSQDRPKVMRVLQRIDLTLDESEFDDTLCVFGRHVAPFSARKEITGSDRVGATVYLTV